MFWMGLVLLAFPLPVEAGTLGDVESALERAVLENLPWAGATFALDSVDVIGQVPPPPWSVELADQRFRGRIRAKLRSAQNAGSSRRTSAWITANIQVMVPVVVSTQPIAAGHSVVDYDVEMRPLRGLPHDFFQDVSALSAVVSRVRIRSGEVLRRTWVQYPMIIKRGQFVRVSVRVGGALVVSQGSAMGAARIHDRARVRLENGTVLDGVVTPDGRVEVVR